MSENDQTNQFDIQEAYGINPYGAVVEIEKSFETLNSEIDSNNDDVSRALSVINENLPELKKSVRVRYNGSTDWIPFHVENTSDGKFVYEYNSEDSRNTRRRAISETHIDDSKEN